VSSFAAPRPRPTRGEERLGGDGLDAARRSAARDGDETDGGEDGEASEFSEDAEDAPSLLRSRR